VSTVLQEIDRSAIDAAAIDLLRASLGRQIHRADSERTWRRALPFGMEL
jgi:hypothetical protein